MKKERRKMKEEIKLKKEGQKLKAELIIGREGLTKEIVLELNKRLKKKKLIKIKIPADKEIDRKEFAEKIALRVGAKAVEVKGFTALIFREK
ncbi:MAG TPA: YhbY family RNA-binding protein [archaeon]|nr:YhbY family RNA-binding protein [archaeon]